ncbi:serine hydrolase domain-containing protein [Paraurantiacibacter namhicola]|uniref:6-aminohexanoate-dimer hydrolase n=1 Tax=Paraurantiacibacter namhicola TaxID=645517 RepID=A0A1C7D8N2_9SPHN|nr:serine hydrolase [Paraurantiacibacter namhicola]ANU07834.1 6-aminohexanoate-dimer hydrolase [Paraurantiacibacter namhicola]
MKVAIKNMLLAAGGAMALTACSAQTIDTTPNQPDVMASMPGGDVAGLQTAATQVLFWDDATRADRFRRMEDFFPGLVVAPSPDPRDLTFGEPMPAAAIEALDSYIAKGDTAGILVLQGGQVRYENYGLGMGPQDRWTSFSMAKSVTSTLAGAALKDGFITSLQDPVSQYIPGLRGSAYDDVTIEQLLTMTSGVAWNEDYTDPASDVARMFAVEPVAGEAQVVTYMKTLPREAPAGEKFVYKTGETNLIGVLVEKATGQSLAAYAKSKIVDPAGFQKAMFWQTDLTGGNVGGCCLALTLQDYGRLGQWTLEGAQGTVPEGWLAAAGSAQTDFGNGFGYGYQWWTYPQGSYGAVGIFGQTITLLPEQDAVIVVLGNWPRATGGDLNQGRLQLVNTVTLAMGRE